MNLWILGLLAAADVPPMLEVFYKEMPPSLETLAAVDSVLAALGEEWTVFRWVITDPAAAERIEACGLPDTHFPFALVLNGSYSAMIDGERIDFVHFPLFMHGIGRHEGNWSLDHLRRVLEDPGLLLERGVRETLDETGWTECLED